MMSDIQFIVDSDIRELKSFGLTHFQYHDGDHLGMLLALISLVPIFLIVAETTIIFSRREVTGVLLLSGQLLNEAFNLALKHIICQDRPHKHLGDGYGMPSSHSQFMGFFAFYVCVYFETQVKVHVAHKRAIQLGAIVLAVLVLLSRVYLRYHTWRQVLVGAIVGIVSGAVWYWIVECIRSTNVFKHVLESNICRWLLIRDSRNVANIALAEYNLSTSTKTKST
ncbi:dolichyldiphosphatase 1 [Coemansia mojavensis]|nr:dolichyldiphosphatase 1 [Coemansia mojavensis]